MFWLYIFKQHKIIKGYLETFLERKDVLRMSLERSYRYEISVLFGYLENALILVDQWKLINFSSMCNQNVRKKDQN